MKVLEAIKNVIVWIIILLAFCVMIFTIVSVSTFDRTDRSIFGYKMFIVQTDSMSATDFSAGDLVVVTETDPSTLQAGDIISFVSRDTSNYGETVTHKIRELTVDDEGNPGFVTYGTTTDSNDAEIVTYPYVIGKYLFAIPKIGTFFAFLKTGPGYLLCILVPFLLLIIIQALNCLKIYKQYKREKQEEIEAKAARIEKARMESERMNEELRLLRAQLGVSGLDVGNDGSGSDRMPSDDTSVSL